MKHLNRTGVRHAVCALLASLGAVGPALADDGTQAMRVPLLPQYRQECGACHVAYPPALLPAASWQRLMANLPRHFGTDASMEAAAVKEYSAWLAANSGAHKRVREPPPGDRITRSAWFVREHDEIPASTWKLPAVKSAANCNACHARANQGEFNEHDIRIPR